MWIRHPPTAVGPHRSAEGAIRTRICARTRERSRTAMASWIVYYLFSNNVLLVYFSPVGRLIPIGMSHFLFRSTHYVHVPIPLRFSVIANCHTLLFYMAPLKRCWSFEKVYGPPLTIRRRFPALDQCARLVSSKKKKARRLRIEWTSLNVLRMNFQFGVW